MKANRITGVVRSARVARVASVDYVPIDVRVARFGSFARAAV